MMAAALLVVGLTACGGKQRNSTNESENSTEETTLPKEHPFFGNILNFYGEKLKEGVNYNIIKQEIGEVIDKAKEFTDYAIDCNVALNFEEFCFIAEDDDKIA